VNRTPAPLPEEAPDEEQLVVLSRDGDTAAFNVLVERYQTAIYNLCLRMLGAQQPAEDAAQEAFISAFRHLDSFRGGSFRSWLFRIASNACYDELRRRKNRRTVSLDEPGDRDDERRIDPPSDAPAMEEYAAQTELRSTIEEALTQLPNDQRLALVLCDVQGMDYAEIAVVMSCSLGTVKSRINRARTRMRALLQQHGELLPQRFRHTGETQ
jgi:RNA polymerase sigma-70 factor, ECF subfamily